MEGVNAQNSQAGGIESGLETEKFENAEFDDDGKPKRTGNVWTASAHIITAIIGSGVLSLAWGVAQLGWIAGVATLLIFSLITLYTSSLLADCYRSPLTGKRNPTYRDVVKSNLGQGMHMLCATVQYVNLIGTLIGYTITASISMAAIQKSNCFHSRGHGVSCRVSHNPYMIGMGILEIFLSQIPNFHRLSFLSMVAAIMSFAYSSIGVGLAFAKVVSGKGGKTSLSGVDIGLGITAADKIWRVFRSFGDIAFAYTYSQILVEIQDTLKASPPENQEMKKARKLGCRLEKEFLAEIKTLGSIWHKNIVKLLCYLSGKELKLLVYEYVENKSLHQWLHGKNRGKSPVNNSSVTKLEWPQRLHIAIGSAQGLCYMHHDCSPTIIHRDIKSMNILLDSEFNAKIADFGLSKLLNRDGDTEIASNVAGTFGYIAPEYVYTTKVNRKTDVYSFGVVLLELTTGREAVTYGDHMNLAERAHLHYNDGNVVIDAIDDEIKDSIYLDQIIAVFKLGVFCTASSPSSRPSMKDCLHILQNYENNTS